MGTGGNNETKESLKKVKICKNRKEHDTSQ